MPMRAIPFRHICLLGMNDGDYPRQLTSVDFDLMRQDYRPGDRSRREDDRYLFLEALLSARESLYLSWAGRSIRDNSERPPSVLVAQLRDYIEDTFDSTFESSVESSVESTVEEPAHDSNILQRITHEYPLQPFSATYFSTESSLGTYASEWAPGIPAQNETATKLPATDPSQPATITLGDLGALLRNPAAVFFDRRLGVVFSRDELTGEDHESFTINGLDQWQIQDQLIRDAQYALRTQMDADSVDTEQLLTALISRQQRQGALPMPPFADLYRQPLIRPLIKPLDRCHTLMNQGNATQPLPVQLTLEDGTLLLEDSVNDILETDNGERLRCVMLSSQIWAGKSRAGGKAQAKVKWHYLARHWPAHLAAQLQGPVRTHILGPDTDEVLAPMTAASARDILQKLMELYQQNLQHPLAADVKTSCAYLTADPEKAPLLDAEREYLGGYDRAGQVQQSEALARLWPDFDSLVLGRLPGDGHASDPAQQSSTTSAFVQHSTQLYQDLIEHWHLHRQHPTADQRDRV